MAEVLLITATPQRVMAVVKETRTPEPAPVIILLKQIRRGFPPIACLITAAPILSMAATTVAQVKTLASLAVAVVLVPVVTVVVAPRV